MKRTRNCLSYKINMWLYRLTFNDIEKIIKNITIILLEALMFVIGFFLLFIFPALFH